MNIFLLSIHPDVAARLLADVHAVKMTLETLQMIWSALLMSLNPYVWPIAPYRIAHINHPSTKWVRYSTENYKWTLQLGYSICKIYQSRYNKVHKCMQHYEELLKLPEPIFRKSTLDSFDKTKLAFCEVPNCCSFFPLAISDEIFSSVAVWKNDVLNGVETYKNYYRYKEKSMKRKMLWNREPNTVDNVFEKNNVVTNEDYLQMCEEDTTPNKRIKTES